MAIEWQDDLATGIDLIDEQHKGIFDRFAEFKRRAMKAAPRRIL